MVYVPQSLINKQQELTYNAIVSRINYDLHLPISYKFIIYKLITLNLLRNKEDTSLMNSNCLKETFFFYSFYNL